MKKPSYLLMDIEGTTTSIDFVHKTLFTYAKNNIQTFLEEHQHDEKVKICLNEAKKIIQQEGKSANSLNQIIGAMCTWIEADRKIGPLKTLQGYIWREGYETGKYVSHIYEDVFQAFKSWQELGIKLGIYSSGSVSAQKLLFAHTEYGDINSFLSFYFDTGVGHKRESISYEEISKKLEVEPQKILFLSDIVEELNAANIASLSTVHVVRPGTEERGYPNAVSSFTELKFDA
ncbi:MAG: acireductone synthase [Oligoflexales bacterium]